MATSDGGYASCDEPRPLVPPGVYDVAFKRYYTWMMLGRAPKLTLCFKIVTYGEHFEQELQRHYNIKKLIGPAGTNGRFKCGFSGDFIREFARLFGAPTRLDRIPMTHFERHILIARVRTVSTGARQRGIPDGLKYSTIDELVAIRA